LFYSRYLGQGSPRGIASMLLGMAAFVVSDSLMKLASSGLPTGQLIFLRGVLAALIVLALAGASGLLVHLPRVLERTVLTRSLFDLIASFLYLIALFHLPIGNITAINMASPLAITAVAALLFKADVGWRRWTAIAIGFLGVLMVVQPSAEGFNAYSGFAVGAVVFVVARDLTTRRIPSAVPSVIVTLANTLVVTTGAFAYSLVEGWAIPTTIALLQLVGTAITVVMGYLLIVDAFRHGEVAVVGPFRYTALIWALLAGYLIWNEKPNLLAICGIFVIVGSGLYVLHRERVRRAPIAARTEPAP
jgi:drug/metabolite transporter (DMT)-like permease